MCEKVAPWLRIPESHSPLGEPGEPEVLLWPPALQVHCTVSPRWIVTDAGEKLKPPSPTVTVKVVALARHGQSARSRPIPSTAATLWSGEVFFPFPFRCVGRLLTSLRRKHIGCSPCELCLCISFIMSCSLIHARRSFPRKVTTLLLFPGRQCRRPFLASGNDG